jgi:Nucleoside-diphosphate-sugar pyrophosphorylase involved in lipopolysaccharide biosynthesis/translation initiation factor 2B, gamma/epsilon subunits (eIF-2Bgamma/eIF-2Bepsilon)
MKALIFAAGLGTRLKPITDSIPKALVKVGGDPLLKHTICNLKNNGFNNIVINIHHFPQQIKDYLSANNNFGINITLSDESNLLRDTGGGIKYAAPLINDNEPFLVHNVDILSNLNLLDFYNFHLSNSISIDTPLATLLVSNRETQRYFLFDQENNLVGWMNQLSGEIKSPYKELCRLKDNNFNPHEFLKSNSLNKYAFGGVHILSPSVFNLMQSFPDKFSIVDFYVQMADKYIIKGYIKNDLEMVDVGKLDTLDEAQEFLRR